MGDVAGSGITGAVDAKDKAGNLEAMLLAGKAAGAWAVKVAGLIPAPAAETTLVILASGDAPTFQALAIYKSQVSIVDSTFEEGMKKTTKANQDADPSTLPPAPAAPMVAPLAAAGITLDAATKLLSYFRSDFSVQGISLTPDDLILVTAAADVFSKKMNYKVVVPTVYSGGLLADNNPVVISLAKMQLQKNTAQQNLAYHQDMTERFAAAAKQKDTKPEAAKGFQSKADIHKSAADWWKAWVAGFDAIFSKLTATDDKGGSPLAAVLKVQALKVAIGSSGQLLVVKQHGGAGAYYTEKNLWTTFGKMPFFVAGGIVGSYSLVDGNSGRVVSAGIIPVHGGYMKVSDVEAALK